MHERIALSSGVGFFMPQNDIQRLLTPTEAAEILSVTRSTLDTWRSREPERLPFVRLSARCVRYRMQDVENYIERVLVGGANQHDHMEKPPA